MWLKSMNEQIITASANKQPLQMTYSELQKALVPYCKGKKPLLDMITDLWKASTPTPNYKKLELIKIIHPKLFEQFTRLVAKENG